MITFLKDLATGLLTTKMAQIALRALLLSTAVIAIVLIIFGFTMSKEGAISAPANLPMVVRTTLSIVFIALFVIIWFIMYVQETRDAEDVYTGIRKQLVGSWRVIYQPTNGSVPVLTDEAYGTTCTIRINPTDGKLEMEIAIDDTNSLYENGVQLLRAVAILQESSNKFQLYYYYKDARRLRPKLKSFLKEDRDFSFERGLEVEFFGLLSFESRGVGGHVTHMQGQWYDLNGRVTQLFALAHAAEVMVAKGQDLLPMRLGEARINAENFSARMGEVKYTRIGGAHE